VKQVYIGTWALGWRNADVYGREGANGGEFYFVPDDKNNARIKIALGYANWKDVLNVLLHETGEFLMQDRNHAYRLSGEMSRDQNNLLFQFRHHEWSEIAAHQADFIAECYDPLKKTWREFNKPVKPKAKAKKRKPAK
jgi:hypothetical protein